MRWASSTRRSAGVAADAGIACLPATSSRTSSLPVAAAASAARAGLELPTVSAVIFNYNGGDRVCAALRRLVAQSFPFADIVVVDNGSTDGSVARLRAAFPQVEIVQTGGNLGLPAARNVGLQRAAGDLVLMLDGDVYVSGGCIERLREACIDWDATLVCPRVLLFPETHIVQCDGAAPHYLGTLSLRHAFSPVAHLTSEPAEVDGCIGACLLVDRARMVAAGGFDDTYFLYFEDLELSLRLRALGHRIVCEPRALVHHDRGSGTAGLSFRGQGRYPPRRAYITMRNRLLLILTFYRLRTIAVLLPVLAVYELATLMLVLSRGWIREWLLAWAWQLGHAGTIMRRRRWLQGARRLADRDLLRGGPPPLAPGLIRSQLAAVPVAALSHMVAWYWERARRWAG
jgi:GT2 family glycosyltransferase